MKNQKKTTVYTENRGDIMKWRYCVEFTNRKVLTKDFDTATEMYKYADKIKQFCFDKSFLKDGKAEIRRFWFERA